MTTTAITTGCNDGWRYDLPGWAIDEMDFSGPTGWRRDYLGVEFGDQQVRVFYDWLGQARSVVVFREDAESVYAARQAAPR